MRELIFYPVCSSVHILPSKIISKDVESIISTDTFLFVPPPFFVFPPLLPPFLLFLTICDIG